MVNDRELFHSAKVEHRSEPLANKHFDKLLDHKLLLEQLSVCAIVHR